jgi:hypothetical protein
LALPQVALYLSLDRDLELVYRAVLQHPEALERVEAGLEVFGGGGALEESEGIDGWRAEIVSGRSHGVARMDAGLCGVEVLLEFNHEVRVLEAALVLLLIVEVVLRFDDDSGHDVGGV